MVFTVLGGVAELERRPKKVLDNARIATLRAHGVGWKRIAVDLGIGVGNAVSARRRGFQNSGNGFWNTISVRPATASLWEKAWAIQIRKIEPETICEYWPQLVPEAL
jgi:hypothetical protein